MVIGGLFSFSILVLVIFAYTFSTSYLRRYPIERMKQSAIFACDSTLTNAQFSSGLMYGAIPANDDESPLFMLFQSQTFIFDIELINTMFKCSDVSVALVKDITLPLDFTLCNDSYGGVSFSLVPPSHTLNLQISFAGTNTIGGLRIGLHGPGAESHNETLNAAYKLSDLNYSQTLLTIDRLLTQQPALTLQIVKVINRTYALEEHGETEFSAIWVPNIPGSLDHMFVDVTEYNYATSTSTVMSIEIVENSYYVLNTQRPITTKDELIFTDLLFTIICLEIFGLGFLIFKLMIIPVIKHIHDYFFKEHSKSEPDEDKSDLTEIYVTRM